jgi:hypothetical protein
MGSRTKRQLVATAVAAGALLLATLVVVLIAHDGGDARPAASSSLPHPTPSATATSTRPSTRVSATPSSSAPAPAGGSTATAGPVVLRVPPGWVAVDSGRFGDVCLEPQHTRPHFGGCAGLQVYYGWDGFLPGYEMGSFGRNHPGWYHATDVQPCPVDPRSGDDYNGVADGTQVGGEQLRPVGDRRAYFYQWSAGCQKSSYRFSPRAWYLPVSKVLMFDYIGYPDIDPIVATARFDDGSWQVGLVRDVSPADSIGFDDLDWRAGSTDFSPDKVRDPDPRVQALRLSGDVTVEALERHGYTWHYRPRTMAWLRGYAAGHPKVAFHVHLTADGVVDRIMQEGVPPTVR